ncbi:MAG: class I SAM-dependent methyltransferase [Clostridia bacterium]|nr:class I SAM-dependent methyltransferase [Clostridia bacterium]
MYIASDWEDYKIIDTGEGDKLERWGKYTLRRPDPQVIWPMHAPHLWDGAMAHYNRSSSGGGKWDFKRKLPERWEISYKDLKFYVRPTGFKHTGLFPEQAVNWDWMSGLIKEAGRPIKVLNLFGYTGGATCACAKAGASVCHVDAAKGMVSWAKENAALSGLSDAPIRYIVDDAIKFVEREIRRGNHYDGILMDPPSYGRGPDGSVWKLEERLYPLVERCSLLLSDEPLFFLINAYTTGLSASVLKNILVKTVVSKKNGVADAQEIGIPVQQGGIVLPCGASGRWMAR